MSDLPITDRRRVPRALIADTELSVLAFPIPVRLLDISLGGVLLEASHRVEYGTRALCVSISAACLFQPTSESSESMR